MNRKDKRYLSFTPIPALVVIISTLYFIVKPSLFYEPPWLLPIMNTIFITVVFFVVAYIAKKNYMATGRIQILFLGCGVLVFGIGGLIAGFVRSVPGAGANLNVTIYNVGALMGAVFHFAAALIVLTGISREVGSQRKRSWLVVSYAGLAVFMGLFTLASLEGILPPFFIQGIGPTALRQWVLGSADILYAFSFLVFLGSYLRNREVFLYWYSSALALTAISLTAFLVESAVGGAIGWGGRFSQYLGGIYFLMAVITTMRSAQVRRTSFDDVLTASLSPAEEKFRALAEHSPDMIERFDKEMKHIYVNQAALRLYGKPADSIIGKTVGEAGFQGTYVSLLEETIRKVFEKAQPMEVEYFVPIEHGTRFYQSHCVPEFGVDGSVMNVLVVSRDLTERKQTEEVLREAHERALWLARFPEENPNPVVRVSVDGTVLYHNRAASELPGWICETGQLLQNELLPLIERAMTERREVQQDVQLRERFYIVWVAPFPDESYVNVYGRDITARKWAEDQLRATLESIGDGFFACDANWRFVYVNAPAERILRIRREEVLGKSHWDVFPLTLGTSVEREYRRAAAGEARDFENFYEPWGRWFHNRCFPRDGGGMSVYFEDITERKRMEEALRESEVRFRALAEAMPQIVWTADAEGGIEWFNQRWYDYTGEPHGIGEGWSWDKVAHPDDMGHTLKNWQEAQRKGALFQNDIRVRGSDGQYRWFLVRAWPMRDVEGKVVRWFGTNTDIDEIRLTEQKLRESEARLNRSEEIAHLGSWELDLINNRLTWSDEVYGIFGLQPQEFRATYEAFLESVHPEDRAAVDAAYSGSIREGRDTYELEHRVVRKTTGEIRTVHERCSHIQDSSGRIIRSVGMVQDITERKLAEEALKRAHDELEMRVQERTSELSEAVERLRTEIVQRKQLEDTLRESENQVRFFASQCLTAQEAERKRIAGELHDSVVASFGAIVFSIEKILGQMEQGEDTRAGLRELIARVRDVNQETRRIMSDLRPSLLDDLGVTPALSWFCREYEKIYSHIRVEKEIDLSEKDLADSLKTAVFRVCQEAMNNIAKHSQATLVNLCLREEDGRIELTIQDNGHGFDVDTVRRGLGLSTMGERAKLSGGAFVLESEIGRGTCVRVSWPR